MATPLGLATQLRLSFSEFVEVRIVREGPGQLRAYCALTKGIARVASDRLAVWSADHVGVGVTLLVDQVEFMPQDLDDEEDLLSRTTVPRVVAESATGTRVAELLCNLFPTEVADVVAVSGHLTLRLYHEVPTSRERVLLDSTRLLMGCDPLSLSVERQARSAQPNHGAHAESTSTYQRLADDRALLHDLVATVLTAERLVLPPLPSGAATYASVHDGVESLLQRLALFERVYVYMPFQIEDFPRWVGASHEEFLDVLSTGRVVPVFGQRLERYEPGLMTGVLEAGAPRVVLQGEHALRMARSFRADHPAIADLGCEVGIQIRSALAGNDDEGSKRFIGYLDALGEFASDFPSVAIKGDSLANALQGVSDWLDAIRVSFGHPSSALELSAALEHRAITEGIGGVPMTQVGHFFDSGIRFAYGAEPGSSDILRVPEPDMIGRICFPDTKGLRIREFAESFTGPRVEAMRELMSSRRVQTADGTVDLVRAFTDELKPYSCRAKNEYVAIVTVMTVVGAFAIGLPIALATLSLELARQMGARKAPAAFATIASKLTRTTREAALLARVQNG